MIRLYWATFPKSKRRKCIFKISCSQYVYQITNKEGFYKGLMALKYRYYNCRGGFHISVDPIDGRKIMILSNFNVLTEDDISERFINPAKAS